MSAIPGNRASEAILRFLPLFETEGYEFGTWEGGGEREPGIFTLPHLAYSADCMEFLEVLYEHGWVWLDFDWPGWQDEAGKYWTAPELIAAADLETLRRLLTTHVRKDRFCEGHLLAAFRDGQIAAILRRLKSIEEAGKMA